MTLLDDELLLDYYQRELVYLRNAGALFAKKYPKVAERLDLTATKSSDPHVERLLESFAFLTARLQRDIDQKFPRVTNALLGVLYPHLVNPIPSTTIAKFCLNLLKVKMEEPFLVPRHSPLMAETPEGQVCRFHTCYDLALVPLEVKEVNFVRADHYNIADNLLRSPYVLRIALHSPTVPLKKLALNKLRFYLGGEKGIALKLYELLNCHPVHAFIYTAPGGLLTPLGNQCIAPLGFKEEENVLPQPPHGLPAYRLLQEYFACPRKFMFLDVENLNFSHAEHEAELLIAVSFDQVLQKSGGDLVKENFALNCVPIINLFPKISEPIHLDHQTTEYRLVGDYLRESYTEIHSISKVAAVSENITYKKEYTPYFSFDHSRLGEEPDTYWFARRVAINRPNLFGSDIYLSFVDLNFNPRRPNMEVVYAHTLCTNRGLADQLNAGALLTSEESVPAEQIMCVECPTRQVQPIVDSDTQWRLISHLASNHLPLDIQDGQAIREILTQYARLVKQEAVREIETILQIEVKKVVRRIGKEAWRGFAEGLAITLTFDDRQTLDNSAFLLASILNHFFSLYVSINSFTELSIKKLTEEKLWKTWRPNTGKQYLL